MPKDHKDLWNSHDNFLPCPFCGKDDIHHESIGGGRYARCQDCSATGGYIFGFEYAPMTRETVVERWNVRAIGKENRLAPIDRPFPTLDP